MRYRIARAVWLIVVMVLASSAARAQQGPGLPADKLEKIEKAITAQMSRQAYRGFQ